jgi:hypothetical protein
VKGVEANLLHGVTAEDELVIRRWLVKTAQED